MTVPSHISGRKFPSDSTPTRASAPQARGFTLVEILVVVSIIALLIAILVPAIYQFKRAGNRAAISAQLNTLQSALQAYYSDLHVFPPSTPGNGLTTGAAMLAEGLLGFQKGAVDGAGTDYNDPSMMGFRVHLGGTGNIYGPYTPFDGKVFNGTNFIDMNGNPILYFAAFSLAGRDAANSANQVTAIFGSSTNAIFSSTDNPGFRNPDGSGIGNPSAAATATVNTPTFFHSFSPSATNAFSGGTVTGMNGYLLISVADDKQFFGNNTIVAGSQ